MTETLDADTLHTSLSKIRLEKYDELINGGKKLAYYTTADTALKVIRGQSIWMRNASLMNDFQEIEYGRSTLCKIWSDRQDEVKAILSSIDDTLFDQIISQWIDIDSKLSLHTYLLSLSEYDDDNRGRLSMWRGYGGDKAGVAFVFKPELLGAISKNELFPVNYGEAEFHRQVDVIVKSLIELQNKPLNIPLFIIADYVTKATQDLVLTTKHPGFREESEWRAIVSSDLTMFVEKSLEVVSIRGIPEKVFKVGAVEGSALALQDSNLNNLIHKIIVGPCRHPEHLAEALRSALKEQDSTKELSNNIYISDIPLRQRE